MLANADNKKSKSASVLWVKVGGVSMVGKFEFALEKTQWW